MLVTHPYVIGAGVAAICLIGIVYANHVYTPFFQAYELGCSPPGEGEKRTGTFFSNQAFATVTHNPHPHPNPNPNPHPNPNPNPHPHPSPNSIGNCIPNRQWDHAAATMQRMLRVRA